MVRKEKAEAKAKAQATKKAARDRQAKRAAAAPTLMERQDILETTGAKKRRKDQPDLHAIVAKALRDNFRGWMEDLTDLTIRDGRSLRQRLLEDLVAKKSGGKTVPMGKFYYSELRATYGNSLAPEKLLQVRDDNDADDQKMIAALQHLFNRRRSVEPLVQWLSSASMVNQKMLVGLFRGCLSSPPTTSPENCKLSIALMEFVVRNNVSQHHAAECGHMGHNTSTRPLPSSS